VAILHWIWPASLAIFVTLLGWWTASRSKPPEEPAGTTA
jgi:hypothetical protein